MEDPDLLRAIAAALVILRRQKPERVQALYGNDREMARKILGDIAETAESLRRTL